MPVNVSAIVDANETATIDYSGIPVQITFNRARYTTALQREARPFAHLTSDSTVEEIEGMLAFIRKMLFTVIERWDLMEDDGKTMVPLTPLRLLDLPESFLLSIFTGLTQALIPKEKLVQHAPAKFIYSMVIDEETSPTDTAPVEQKEHGE